MVTDVFPFCSYPGPGVTDISTCESLLGAGVTDLSPVVASQVLGFQMRAIVSQVLGVVSGVCCGGQHSLRCCPRCLVCFYLHVFVYVKCV